MFDFIPTKDAVLFLDEMDAIGKLRDDRDEFGELKRVVNTVLQGLVSLADEVIAVGATNHPHLRRRSSSAGRIRIGYPSPHAFPVISSRMVAAQSTKRWTSFGRSRVSQVPILNCSPQC